MHISSILDVSNVAVRLPVQSKKQALNAMIDLLAKSPKVLDIDKVRASIFDREKIMSTGVGHGFAIPHGKTDALTDIVAAFATTEEPIDFESLDDQPVSLIFMLVGKETQVGTHLKLLSRVSRLMNNEEFRQHLLQATTSAQALSLFDEEENKYFEA